MSQIDASKIKEKTNNLITYELMRRNEEMKKSKLKHITYIFIAVLVLAGGTFSVDAMTDNSISNAVKDALKIKVNNEDYNAKCDKTSDGMMKCILDESVLGNSGEAILEISEEYIGDIEVEANATDDEVSISINSNIEQ